MASEEQGTEEQQEQQEVQEQQQAAGRRSRSDKGLPRRRTLLLSRAASARFVRVAAALPGGEEELAGLLEPIIEQLFEGKFVSAAEGDGSGPTLEDIAIAAFSAKVRREAGDA